MTHSVPARLTPRTEIDISRGITTGGSPGGHIGLTATARHSGPGRKTFTPNGNVVRALGPALAGPPRCHRWMLPLPDVADRRTTYCRGRSRRAGTAAPPGLTVGTDTRSCCRSPRDGRSCVRLRTICTSPRRGLHILTVAPHLDLDLAGQRYRCCQLAGAGRRMPAGLVSPRRPARSGIRPRGCRR